MNGIISSNTEQGFHEPVLPLLLIQSVYVGQHSNLLLLAVPDGHLLIIVVHPEELLPLLLAILISYLLQLPLPPLLLHLLPPHYVFEEELSAHALSDQVLLALSQSALPFLSCLAIEHHIGINQIKPANRCYRLVKIRRALHSCLGENGTICVSGTCASVFRRIY